MRRRTKRIAYLYAAEGGLRVGDPEGAHLFLVPDQVRICGVGQDGSAAPGRSVEVDFDAVRVLRIDAPVSDRPGFLSAAGAVLAFAIGLGDGEPTAASVDVLLEASDPQVLEPWHFSLPGPMRRGFPRDEVRRAGLVVSRLVDTPSLRKHLGDPSRLVGVLRSADG